MIDFSVIMNCYNCDKYLKVALESVLFQSYTNLEIIFWDNQSNDKSASIVKSYKDKRIHYFLAKKFTPLGEARNLAINKARGKWIAFLDCDDIWDLNKLFNIRTEIQYSRYDNLALIYSKSYFIDHKNDIISNKSYIISGNIYKDLLIKGNFIVFSSIIIKRDILISSGKINANLQYCPDYELLLKITKYFNTVGINKYLTLYRVHNESITSTKLFENNTEVIRMLQEFADKNKLDFLLKFKIFINNSYRVGVTIIKLFLNKEIKNSLIFFKKHSILSLFFPVAFFLNLIQRKKYDQ